MPETNASTGQTHAIEASWRTRARYWSIPPQSMTMTGPAELKDRMVALWASHAEWMKASHHRGGDKACLFYHQCISEEMNDFTKGRPELGAGAEPTGNTTITVIEFYASKAGLDEHFKLFHEGAWAGGEEFGALMGTGKVSFAGAGYGETLVSVANDEFALE